MSNKTVIRIKKSVVVLGESSLLDELKRFDLSAATPMDCFDFIKDIKARYDRK